jgi:hypothetical protein
MGQIAMYGKATFLRQLHCMRKETPPVPTKQLQGAQQISLKADTASLTYNLEEFRVLEVSRVLV